MAGERICIVTDEISQDIADIERFSEENEINAFDIRTMGGARVPDIPDDIWSQVVQKVEDQEWKIISLSPGIFKGDFRAKRLLRKQIEDVVPRTIEKAKQVGAKYIIAFAFKTDTKISPPDYIVSAMRTAADLCDDAGLILLLENEPGTFADNGLRTASLIGKVGHPSFLVSWDPCNTNIFDHRELAQNAQALARKIMHVHVKDGKPIPNSSTPMYGPIRTGELGWKDHLIELKGQGYSGYLSIETHFEPLYESSTELLEELREVADEVSFF